MKNKPFNLCLMEKLLHYVWKYKLFPLKPLLTTKGLKVEIIDTGLPNPNAGPDFFNAKIKIDGMTWVGNVEIHRKSGDWFRHNHHTDSNYNNVILHVVETADEEILTADHKIVPQMTLQIPEQVRRNYEELCATIDYPRCHRVIPHIAPFTIHSWLNTLLYERLEQRTALFTNRLRTLNGDWEAAYFATLARNFGFGINGDAFEEWSKHIPLSATGKHRDNLFQIEAIFMGQAGLLTAETIPENYRAKAEEEGYFDKLKKEYDYLAHKFSLTPMSAEAWKFLRLRPQNFPHIRLSQLAQLYFSQRAGLSAILAAETVEELQSLLSTHTTAYWDSHYIFGCPSATSTKHLTVNSLNLLIINTVVPVMYAYGVQHHNDNYCDKALRLLEPIKAENNRITRQWAECGINVCSAMDSQALIQLKKAYCDKIDCLRCRFGYEFMKHQYTTK